ncbi:hypothetical protein [Homoserinibacter sp. YIM 151385]|uniref:hypothetical protein n=1 Tax=Homoserinibacter sp. YIM 151385 TaxID=2985506 RepID=UPI0022F11F39|nr:hypothetical protein [Homoserinibacter sp. YIM 151385]WBU39121.1 hypothetical protein OF852_05975 [Homoserinibacter sp. YIM 151385]
MIEIETEEQALKAAVQSYERFLETSSLILHDGGKDPERIDAVAGEPLSDQEKLGFQRARENDWRSTGYSSVTNATLHETSVIAGKDLEIRLLMCVDYSNTDVLDVNGSSVVEGDGPRMVARAVAFRLVNGELLPVESNRSDRRPTCVR